MTPSPQAQRAAALEQPAAPSVDPREPVSTWNIGGWGLELFLSSHARPERALWAVLYLALAGLLVVLGTAAGSTLVGVFVALLCVLLVFCTGLELLNRRAVFVVPRRGELSLTAAFGLVIYGDIVSQIENAIASFFQSVWNGIQNFFGQIGQSIVNLVVSIFQAPINAVNASWGSFTTWADQFGPLAPLFVVLMLAAFLVVVVFVLWLLVKLSVSEGEETAEEAEEGV